MPQTGTVARAFDLAKGGTCRNITDIRTRLVKEGYGNIQAHLDGRAIKRQLTTLIKAGLTEAAPAGPATEPLPHAEATLPV